MAFEIKPGMKIVTKGKFGLPWPLNKRGRVYEVDNVSLHEKWAGVKDGPIWSFDLIFEAFEPGPLDVGTLDEIGAKPGDMVKYDLGLHGQFILPDHPVKVASDMSVFGIPYRLNKSSWRIVTRNRTAPPEDMMFGDTSAHADPEYLGNSVSGAFERAHEQLRHTSQHITDFSGSFGEFGFRNGRILGSMIKAGKLVGDGDFDGAEAEIYSAMSMMALMSIEVRMRNRARKDQCNPARST